MKELLRWLSITTIILMTVGDDWARQFSVDPKEIPQWRIEERVESTTQKSSIHVQRVASRSQTPSSSHVDLREDSDAVPSIFQSPLEPVQQEAPFGWRFLEPIKQVTEETEDVDEVEDQPEYLPPPITSSPLDEGKPLAVNMASSTKGLSFDQTMNNLTKCQQDCSEDLQKALGLVMKDMNHVDRYHELCSTYNTTYACVLDERMCGHEDPSMFDVITSGLKYMCVEQALAFNATIVCIDSNANFVTDECEGECQSKNIFMNWIMRSSLAQGIQDGIMSGLNGMQGGGGGLGGLGASLQGLGGSEGLGASQLGAAQLLPQQPLRMDPGMMDNFRQFSSDLCKVGDCFLECIKKKFNARCEGSAGTLLAEVLVRPIATGQQKMSMFGPLMGMFVPDPCQFLYSTKQLSKHRIDPTMDKELRRMYSEKETERLLAESATMPSLNDLQPFLVKDPPSPFDGKTDLALLVDQYYNQRSNNNEATEDAEQSTVDDSINDSFSIDNSTEILETPNSFANSTAQEGFSVSTNETEDFVTFDAQNVSDAADFLMHDISDADRKVVELLNFNETDLNVERTDKNISSDDNIDGSGTDVIEDDSDIAHGDITSDDNIDGSGTDVIEDDSDIAHGEFSGSKLRQFDSTEGTDSYEEFMNRETSGTDLSTELLLSKFEPSGEMVETSGDPIASELEVLGEVQEGSGDDSNEGS